MTLELITIPVSIGEHSLTGVEEALKSLDRLDLEIQNPKTFARLMAAQNKAAAVQLAFKDVKIVSDRAGELVVAADVVFAERLDEVGKAEGTRGTLTGKDSSGGYNLSPPEGATPTLAELMPDISRSLAKKRSARARKLAAIPKAERAKAIEELKEADRPVTPANVIQAVKKQQNEKKRKAIKAKPPAFSNEGPFDVVVIDPPWPMQKIEREVRPNQSDFDYPTMSIEEIAKFWKANIATRLETDCHVFIWTTQRFLPDAITMIGEIGLKYVLTMVWHKPGGFQPIGLPQYNCEFAVYARKGVPRFVETKDFYCCFSAPRREHSRKPDQFYDLVARVTGGARIDVFSREKRDGFWQYGNEADKFSGAA